MHVQNQNKVTGIVIFQALKRATEAETKGVPLSRKPSKRERDTHTHNVPWIVFSKQGQYS